VSPVSWFILFALCIVAACCVFDWYAKWNERRALRRLKEAHASLSPEQQDSKLARRVEWYANLPKESRTPELWKWVEDSDDEPPRGS
jgi:hypothetical protein